MFLRRLYWWHITCKGSKQAPQIDYQFRHKGHKSKVQTNSPGLGQTIGVTGSVTPSFPFARNSYYQFFGDKFLFEMGILFVKKCNFVSVLKVRKLPFVSASLKLRLDHVHRLLLIIERWFYQFYLLRWVPLGQGQWLMQKTNLQWRNELVILPYKGMSGQD